MKTRAFRLRAAEVSARLRAAAPTIRAMLAEARGAAAVCGEPRGETEGERILRLAREERQAALEAIVEYLDAMGAWHLEPRAERFPSPRDHATLGATVVRLFAPAELIEASKPEGGIS